MLNASELRSYSDAWVFLGYVSDSDGQPILPPGMKDHMYEDLNRSFDF
jgi:hypothetical protein